MTRARSLLFLSCDIVGSTRFKQLRGNLWHLTFLSFYRQFPQVLGDLTREAKYDPGFELWKPVGDELIFTSEVTCEDDVFRAVRIWLEAMTKYETESLDDTSLATKGGAFIATFPGPDSESSIPRNPLSETSDAGVVELNDLALANRTEEYMYDYFGPSIDTGFRVLSACTQRFFTISVEVAWAMAQCAVDAGVSSTHPLEDLLLLDEREFKGVWAGRAYPLFALDRDSRDLVNLAMAKLRNTTADPGAVADLCKQCSADDGWPSRMYLPASEHALFRLKPTDSLDPLRSNSMEGAETLPGGEQTGEDLADNAPLGDVTPPASDPPTDTDVSVTGDAEVAAASSGSDTA